MKTLSRIGMFAVMLAAITSTLACGGGPRGSAVYVRTAPPPVVIESRGVAPGPGYYWMPGYHTWNGNSYVWSAGRWDHVPAGRHDWVPGHWAHSRHGYYWVEGHWR